MAICSKNLRQKIRNYRFAVKNAIEKDQNDFLGDRFFSLLLFIVSLHVFKKNMFERHRLRLLTFISHTNNRVANIIKNRCMLCFEKKLR